MKNIRHHDVYEHLIDGVVDNLDPLLNPFELTEGV